MNREYHSQQIGKLAKMGRHPGFAGVASSISKREGVPIERAGAILAAATRRASPAAKIRNPALRKV